MEYKYTEFFKKKEYANMKNKQLYFQPTEENQKVDRTMSIKTALLCQADRKGC